MTRSTKACQAKYLPKVGRKPGAIKFVLTERDLEILHALGRYRYLRTGQIARLVFPNSSTVQSARRRLKYLYHAGYVGRIQPLSADHMSQAEIAYFLEKAGLELLESPDELPRYSQKPNVKPLFLRHALQLSEFRLNLERAITQHPGISLHRVVMDHEMKQHTENAVGKRRYRLFDEVFDPSSRRNLIVHPDMLFILRSELSDGRVFQRLFFVEIDMGTEGLRVIDEKLMGYSLYKREGLFKKFGDFDDFRVLIQTNSERRQENISKLCQRFEGLLDAWTTTDGQVNEATMLIGRIWTNNTKIMSSILRNDTNCIRTGA